ncbi:MAG TPA: inorganic phosphate transporter [Patescibacteria group bacterium]|nr:inorganic phosphate transporter [Patescibacteria group bacterium]
MSSALILLALTVLLALAFDFINGFHDSANAIATVVSTKVMKPRTAVLYGGALNFAGAMMGTQVAATIGKGLVNADTINIHTVLCSVIAAIVWNLITWYKGLPTSSSHALIGSLLGATFISAGWNNIVFSAVEKKVLIPMIVSPMLGISIGFALMLALTWGFYRMRLQRINSVFGKLQIISAGFMAFNHGQNDAQKSMGIIALALVLTYHPDHFSVPVWVMVSCAIAMGLGTMLGGWRIIHTMGSKMIKLQPINGFAAETTASMIIAGASHFGIPVSTTHVISTAIMGVGATKRLSAVRWGIVGNIVWAWLLTIPLTFLLAAAFMALAKAF